MRNTIQLGLMLGVLFYVGGCATVMRGDSQKIKFDTDPAGAKVEVAGGTYTTPVEVALKRKIVHIVTISKEGCQSITFTMASTWDGASLVGVALPGGSVSAASDRLSGADLAFYPLPKIKLLPATGPTTQPVTMYQHRRNLLNQEEHDKLMAEEHEEILHKQIGF